MKRLLVLALAGLLAFLPFAGQASLYTETPQELVTWAGCKARLITSDQYPVISSMYDFGSHTIYIGTRSGTPRDLELFIIFHEIGHCLQDQWGTRQADPANELDADKIAANLLCSRGMEGKRIGKAIMDWAKQVYDYDGDEDHGTAQQRVEAAQSAPACQLQIQGAYAG